MTTDKPITILIVTSLVCILSTNAHGEDSEYRHPHKRSINSRQKAQHYRIKEGVKSGELTLKEARMLIHKENRFKRLERRLKSDGTLTPNERARLQRRLNQLSKEIYHQKHDEQSTD